MMQERLIVITQLLSGVCFMLALLSFFVKLISEKFLIRRMLNFVVKYHKIFGAVSILSVFALSRLAVTANRYSLSGMIVAFSMLAMLLTGIYGTFVKKGKKGAWFILHRFFVALLIVLIIIHFNF